ncbi:MAG: hypothetical protein H6619_04340 [Deltaproteobacteria bacterium]|nr:hypothetical protein [Deltaproteobacteria bacterium]
MNAFDTFLLNSWYWVIPATIVTFFVAMRALSYKLRWVNPSSAKLISALIGVVAGGLLALYLTVVVVPTMEQRESSNNDPGQVSIDQPAPEDLVRSQTISNNLLFLAWVYLPDEDRMATTVRPDGTTTLVPQESVNLGEVADAMAPWFNLQHARWEHDNDFFLSRSSWYNQMMGKGVSFMQAREPQWQQLDSDVVLGAALQQPCTTGNQPPRFALAVCSDGLVRPVFIPYAAQSQADSRLLGGKTGFLGENAFLHTAKLIADLAPEAAIEKRDNWEAFASSNSERMHHPERCTPWGRSYLDAIRSGGELDMRFFGRYFKAFKDGAAIQGDTGQELYSYLPGNTLENRQRNLLQNIYGEFTDEVLEACEGDLRRALSAAYWFCIYSGFRYREPIPQEEPYRSQVIAEAHLYCRKVINDAIHIAKPLPLGYDQAGRQITDMTYTPIQIMTENLIKVVPVQGNPALVTQPELNDAVRSRFELGHGIPIVDRYPDFNPELLGLAENYLEHHRGR